MLFYFEFVRIIFFIIIFCDDLHIYIYRKNIIIG